MSGDTVFHLSVLELREPKSSSFFSPHQNPSPTHQYFETSDEFCGASIHVSFFTHLFLSNFSYVALVNDVFPEGFLFTLPSSMFGRHLGPPPFFFFGILLNGLLRASVRYSFATKAVYLFLFSDLCQSFWALVALLLLLLFVFQAFFERLKLFFFSAKTLPLWVLHSNLFSELEPGVIRSEMFRISPSPCPTLLSRVGSTQLATPSGPSLFFPQIGRWRCLLIVFCVALLPISSCLEHLPPQCFFPTCRPSRSAL